MEMVTKNNLKGSGGDRGKSLISPFYESELLLE